MKRMSPLLNWKDELCLCKSCHRAGFASFPEWMLTFSRHAPTKLDRALLQACVRHILSAARPILFPAFIAFVIASLCFYYVLFISRLPPLHIRGVKSYRFGNRFWRLSIQTSKKPSARSSFLACAEEVSRTSEQRPHKYRKPQKVFFQGPVTGKKIKIKKKATNNTSF